MSGFSDIFGLKWRASDHCSMRDTFPAKQAALTTNAC